jgi:hypothetical protein
LDLAPGTYCLRVYSETQEGDTGNYMDPMSPADVMAFVRAEQQMWKPVLEQIARNP